MRMRGLPPIMLALAASPAIAHEGVATSPDTLWRVWRPHAPLGMTLFAVFVVYGCGLWRLWGRTGIGRGVRSIEAGAFAVGGVALILALLSPLETLATTLLSAHMAQHMLLITLAPPLLLLGRPDAVLAAAAPARWRKATVRSAWLRSPARAFRRLARPLPAALLHAAAIWAWHAPVAFQAALGGGLLHHGEHAAFLLTALLFWQAVIHAARSPSMLLPAIVAVLVTLIQSGLLGALLTFSGQPLYPAHGERAVLWGLTPIEDQQLAGLIMWAPVGGIYVFAGLALASKLIAGAPVIANAQESSRRSPPRLAG
jgi:putative membrane protein